MSVYRPSGSKVWWYEFMFSNQRIRESTKTRSKTLALEAERQRRRELERAFNGVKKRSSSKLFNVAADEWLTLKSLTLAPSSLRIEKDNLKHIKPSFGQFLVSDIQATDIASYEKLPLTEGASPTTINLEVGTIRSRLRRNRYGPRFNKMSVCWLNGLILGNAFHMKKSAPYYVPVSRAAPGACTRSFCWR